MKKRLRKKKHKGEFAVLGRQIVVRRSSSNDPQAFLDRFIEIVEANGCVCGGSSSPEVLDVVIELGQRNQNLDQRMNEIVNAIRSDTTVSSIAVGDEFDVWYGDPIMELKSSGATAMPACQPPAGVR